MKKFAIAVLFLFAANLIGSAFASGCVMVPKPLSVGAQTHVLPCCAPKVSCIGGKCFAKDYDVGCASDHGTIVAYSSGQSLADTITVPASHIVSAQLLAVTERNLVARPLRHRHEFVPVLRYANIHARTGRLLI